MILYVTKETADRYKLKMPDELKSPIACTTALAVMEKESGDRFFEWGGKLFYFDRRKCIQVVHFASKLTFVLVDVKIGDLENVGHMIAFYLMELYKGNSVMTNLLKKYFDEATFVCFAKLQDRGIVSTLNHTQLTFLDDGYRLYDFIQDGILHTKDINIKLNRNWAFSEIIDGEKDYYYAAEKFEKLLRQRYSEKGTITI